MSQAFEDTKECLSWNRTPGKPNSSNISSSTDSGVGRTPNWTSDSDCKFTLMDANPWSNSAAILSPDNKDTSANLSWDETTSKMSNNPTFGFPSQWANDNSLSSNLNNPSWSLPVTTAGDTSWNIPSCQSRDNYLSIWSNNTQRQFSDHESDHNTAEVDSADRCEMPTICAFHNDEAGEKIVESQHPTAVGAGTYVSSDDGASCSHGEISEEYLAIINRVEGWGSHTVDQTTPWVDAGENLADTTAATVANRLLAATTTESNVWTNEPPTGVGVWESHYETIGEKTARWNNAGVKIKATGWEQADVVIGGQWGERECDKSVWLGPGPKETQIDTLGGRNTTQRNGNALGSVLPSPATQSLMTGHDSAQSSDSFVRQSYYHNNQQSLVANQSRGNVPGPMRGMAYDGQPGMGTHQLMSDWHTEHNDHSSYGTQSSLVNGSGIHGGSQGAAASKIHEQQTHSRRTANTDSHNQLLLFEKQIIKEIHQLQGKQEELMQRITALRSIAGSGAIVQEMTRTLGEVRQQLSTQQTTVKVLRSQQQQHMMMMPPGPSNHVTGPRGMHGSQSSMPGGSSSTHNPTMADLSLHMNDVKIQKRNMDLWPQGHLPPSNTNSAMTPYAAMDKYYGPSTQMNGPIPPSYNYTIKQPTFVPPPSSHHPQHNRLQQQQYQPPGPAWPSRGVPNYSVTPTLALDDIDSAMASSSYPCPTTALTATTALSLSQTLSAGNSVSSAFTPRDISFASANISEFVPGQPWPGVSYSQRDDPNITLGTGQRGLLSVTNDHLERLANYSASSLLPPSSHDAASANGSNMNRLSSGTNGANNRVSMMATYVLIRDLPNHINIEMLRNVLTSQSFPGLIQMQPNLAARWVLLHFNSNEESLRAFKNLYGKVGVVELVPDQEVSQRLQYNTNNNNNTNCTLNGPVIGCSAVNDYQPTQQQQHQATQQQQQASLYHQSSQSHYLH